MDGDDDNVPFCSASLPRVAEMGSPVLPVEFHVEPARRRCRVEMVQSLTLVLFLSVLRSYEGGRAANPRTGGRPTQELGKTKVLSLPLRGRGHHIPASLWEGCQAALQNLIPVERFSCERRSSTRVHVKVLLVLSERSRSGEDMSRRRRSRLDSFRLRKRLATRLPTSWLRGAPCGTRFFSNSWRASATQIFKSGLFRPS